MTDEAVCVCGKPATEFVQVQWTDGPRSYSYCAQCADDTVTYIEGAEFVPAEDDDE